MPNVGELVATATMRTAPFQKGAARVRGGMKGMQQESKKTSASVKLMNASFAAIGTAAVAGIGVATAAFAQFSGMIKEQFGEIDRIAKLADRTGFSTESIAALELGADLSGSSVAELNKGLEAFTRRIGEAAMGTGEATTALKTLGLDAGQLSRMPAIEALKLVADRLNGVTTQAERSALAVDLFSRAGSGPLLNFLQSGSKGLEEFEKKVAKAGSTFSAFEADKIEAANDALREMREALTGVARQFAIAFAPTVTQTAEKFGSTISLMADRAPELADAFTKAAPALVKMSESFAKILASESAMDAVVSLFDRLATIMEKIDKILSNPVIGRLITAAGGASISPGAMLLDPAGSLGLRAGDGGTVAPGARRSSASSRHGGGALSLLQRQAPGDTVHGGIHALLQRQAQDRAVAQMQIAGGASSFGDMLGGMLSGVAGELSNRTLGIRERLSQAFSGMGGGTDGIFGAGGGTRGNADIERAIARSRFGGARQRDKLQKQSVEKLTAIQQLLNRLLGVASDVTIEQVTL